MTPEEKIAKLKADGVSNLHIISDFDKTLTKAYVNGNKHQSSYALLRDYGYLPEEYSQKARAEWSHFYPIESDPSLSVEEKIPHMEQWWKNHWTLLVEYAIKEEQLRQIVKDGKVSPRYELNSFFEVINANNIPTLIFSAGMGNIIQIFLENEGYFKDNVHIISNFLIMENGVASDFKTPLIHTFNKNESVLADSPFLHEVTDRKNVILIGDSIGDTTMASGFVHDCVLKIGFLNVDDSDVKQSFEENYDIVIEGDGSMQPVLDILQQIL